MTSEEVQRVEQLVNSWVQQDHTLATHVVPLQEAKDKGQQQRSTLPCSGHTMPHPLHRPAAVPPCLTCKTGSSLP